MKDKTSASVATTPVQRQRKLALQISSVIDGSPLCDALTAMMSVVAVQISSTARSDQAEYIACHYAQMLLDAVQKQRTGYNRRSIQ
ncbi:hypothetical protein NZA98_35960 [Escherichia coli]|nr:hypothetical protein [Escherichia coli]